MFKKTKLNANDLGTLFFLAALIFGAWFRALPPYLAGFPINDGGLFYKMIEAVRENHYRLPETVHYNGLNIPFAYPPFAFYLAGGVADLFGKPLMDVVLWFPAIVLIAIIPAVFYFANAILKSRLQAGLATLLYALLPRSITWLIMGGGVTRGLGQLFLILAVANVYLLFAEKQKKRLLSAMIFSALVCATHPEAALHTVGIALVLWLFYGRNKDGMINALIVALGTALLTSIWWLPVLARFGLDPYLSAAQTGLNGLSYSIVLFAPYSGEPFMTIIALLAILGFAAQVAKGEYLLPALLAVPFVVEPRSAANVSIIPMALLASVALTDLLLPALARIESAARNIPFKNVLQSRSEKLLFFYLLFCVLIGMHFFASGLNEKRVSPEHRQAFAWIQQNAPADGKFLIITGKTDLFADPINEWFPVLTNRVSLTTIQGYEWVGQGAFAEKVPVMQSLQRCAALTCIESAAQEAGVDYDYIYVANANANLIYDLQSKGTYSSAYEKDGIVIFRREKR